MWKDRPAIFSHDITMYASLAPSLNQLSKNHSRPNALASTLFLLLVRDAGATLEGTVCSRRGSLAHGRSRSVGLSVSIEIARSETLASSQRRRNSPRCEHHNLPPCLEPLSRGCPSTRTIHAPGTFIEPTLIQDNSLIDNHSASVSPSAAMPLIVCL